MFVNGSVNIGSCRVLLSLSVAVVGCWVGEGEEQATDLLCGSPVKFGDAVGVAVECQGDQGVAHEGTDEFWVDPRAECGRGVGVADGVQFDGR